MPLWTLVSAIGFSCQTINSLDNDTFDAGIKFVPTISKAARIFLIKQDHIKINDNE